MKIYLQILLLLLQLLWILVVIPQIIKSSLLSLEKNQDQDLTHDTERSNILQLAIESSNESQFISSMPYEESKDQSFATKEDQSLEEENLESLPELWRSTSGQPKERFGKVSAFSLIKSYLLDPPWYKQIIFVSLEMLMSHKHSYISNVYCRYIKV